MLAHPSMFSQSVEGSEAAESDTTIWSTIYDDALIAIDDGLGFATEPARFDAGDWIFTGVLFGGTMLTMVHDAELREIRLRNSNVSPDVQHALEVFTDYGNIGKVSAAVGSVYLTGLISDVYYSGGWFEYGELRRFARMLGESLFFSGSIAAVMRSLLGRKRPYNFKPGQEDIWAYELLNMKTSKNAFPSGHMVVTMALSTTIAEYFDTWVARTVCYTLAALGLAARLQSDGHWTSDIVFGSGLGISTGLYIAHKYRQVPDTQRDSGSSGETSSLKLYPVPGGMGIMLRF